LVDILVEVAGATSWWDATAERIPDTDDWLICFKYRWPPFDGPTLEWCTPSNDPSPPPPPGPGPAPPGWPEEYTYLTGLSVTQFSGFECCFAGIHYGADLDGSTGPWGGWVGVIEASGCPDLFWELYPSEWLGDVVTWVFRWDIVGGGSGEITTTADVGEYPYWNLEVGDPFFCPVFQGLLSVWTSPP
jgi:hypothetical protein